MALAPTGAAVMIRQAMRHAVVASPLTTLAMHGIPWWSVVIAVSLGPVAYMCRTYLLYRLADKALDKASSNQVPAIITAITGLPSASQSQEARDRSGAVRPGRANRPARSEPPAPGAP
jgi:hypothetical protein